MKSYIKKENYNLVTNPRKVMKMLSKKNILKNLDDELTNLYLKYLTDSYTIIELKIMKETLNNETKSKSSTEAIFVAVFSVLIVLITTVISVTIDINNFNLIVLAVIIMSIYMLLIIIYYFRTQIEQSKRVKLINHLNLLFELQEISEKEK